MLTDGCFVIIIYLFIFFVIFWGNRALTFHMNHLHYSQKNKIDNCYRLTLKVQVTTAADDIQHCFLLFFWENKTWHFMWIVCQVLFVLKNNRNSFRIWSATITLGSLRVNTWAHLNRKLLHDKCDQCTKDPDQPVHPYSLIRMFNDKVSLHIVLSTIQDFD